MSELTFTQVIDVNLNERNDVVTLNVRNQEGDFYAVATGTKYAVTGAVHLDVNAVRGYEMSLYSPTPFMNYDGLLMLMCDVLHKVWSENANRD